jgi:hypothetical protein
MIPMALLMTGCASTSPSSPAPSGAPSEIPTANAPSEAPGEASQAAVSSSPGAGQTDTEWGRIWDTVPATFPRFPGSNPADDAAAEPVSARFAVPGGDPQAIATWMQGALERAHLSTVGLNGPAEDGSFVLDSVGDGTCRMQTTIAPLGDMTFISVLYGSDCPATQM